MRDRSLIAIVDDDVSVCKALSRLIRSARMDAETFNSADEFLATGEKHEPDCIVLDLQMPGMTGLELGSRLAAKKSRIPVILITAHDSSDVRAAASASGMVAYLTKPINDQLLLDTISQALKGWKARNII